MKPRKLLLATFIALSGTLQAASPSPSVSVLSSTDKSVTLTTNAENSPFSISSGVLLLNPYGVTNYTGGNKTRGNLTKADSTRAKFFVQVSLDKVFAWDADGRDRFTKAYVLKNNSVSMAFWSSSKENFFDIVDIQGKMMFVSKDNSKETTAAALVGAGEFGGEVTVGLPIYRSVVLGNTTKDKGVVSSLATVTAKQVFDSTVTVQWIGPVASYSAVTDASAFDIHNRIFGGLGYRLAYRTSRGRDMSLTIHGGIAAVDSVDFISSNTREVRFHHGDVLEYKMKTTGAFEAELNYPLTDTLSVTMGTRFYAGLDPSVWNAYIGVTVDDLGKLLGLSK